MVSNLTKKEMNLSAFALVVSTINGQRNFLNEDNNPCVTCAEPKAIKKCSKCRAVQYCDRQCQRLHWFMHKKSCTRPSTVNNATQETSDHKATVRSNTVDGNAIRNAVNDAIQEADVSDTLGKLKVN